MTVRYLAAALAASAALIPAAPTLAQECVPEVVTVTPTPGETRNILVQGDLAYVTDGTGMLIYDVADPTAPREIGFFDTLEPMDGVAVANGLAFIVEGRFFSNLGDLEIVDVTDPTNPVFLSRTRYSNRPIAVSARDNVVYLSMGDRIVPEMNFLLVLDVSDPTSPQEITRVPTRQWPHWSLIQDDLLYLALRAGFDIYDISSPRDPVLLGTTDVPSLALKLAVLDGYAYLAEFSQGLRIIDIHDPTNPFIVSNIEVPNEAVGVAVQGGIAIVTHNPFPGGMRVIDIRDPENPVIIGAYDSTHSFGNAAFVGSFVLGAGIHDGLVTFDISSCAICPADLDGDRNADSKDFFFFLDAFAANNLAVCDIDADGDCDANDFFAYLDRFAAGC